MPGRLLRCSPLLFTRCCTATAGTLSFLQHQPHVVRIKLRYIAHLPCRAAPKRAPGLQALQRLADRGVGLAAVIEPRYHSCREKSTAHNSSH